MGEALRVIFFALTVTVISVLVGATVSYVYMMANRARRTRMRTALLDQIATPRALHELVQRCGVFDGPYGANTTTEGLRIAYWTDMGWQINVTDDALARRLWLFRIVRLIVIMTNKRLKGDKDGVKTIKNFVVCDTLAYYLGVFYPTGPDSMPPGVRANSGIQLGQQTVEE